MNQSELEANTCNRRQARENACEQVAIGLTFTSDWWRKWREIFQPITERSKAKPKQNANYFRHSNENCSKKQYLGFILTKDTFVNPAPEFYPLHLLRKTEPPFKTVKHNK